MSINPLLKRSKPLGIPNTNESNRVEKITTTQEFRQKIDMIFVLNKMIGITASGVGGFQQVGNSEDGVGKKKQQHVFAWNILVEIGSQSRPHN